MSGDPLEAMQRDARVGEPGQPGVPQIVPTQVLVAEFGHDLIPVSCLAQHSCCDAATARPDKQPSVEQCSIITAPSGRRGGSR